MTRSRLIGTLLVLVAVLCEMSGVAVAAVPYGIAPNARVLHLSFHTLHGSLSGSCGGQVLTSGDYALVPFAGGKAFGVDTCSPVALINDRTGKQTLIRHGGRAEVLAFGAPWVLFEEIGAGNNDTVLYNIVTRRTARLRRCGIACSQANKEPLSYRLGSQWLAITFQHYAPCGDGIHDSCGPLSVTYYNLITHQVRVNARTSPRTTIDLDAAKLVVPVCSPVMVPAGGSFTRYGPFAVTAGESIAILQRCGSTRQRLIGDPYAAGFGGVVGNAHLLLWPPASITGFESHWVQGVELPSLTPVAINTPGSAVATSVDNEALYVVDETTGKVSTARLPAI